MHAPHRPLANTPGLRLLPWTSPEGLSCYVKVGQASGVWGTDPERSLRVGAPGRGRWVGRGLGWSR